MRNFDLELAANVGGLNRSIQIAGELRGAPHSTAHSFTSVSIFVIMADMPTSTAWTLIDVEKVGMLLLSHLRCRFKVLELFLGCLLARKDEFCNIRRSTTSVVTLKPATCGHFKTGHLVRPET
jgi:hypothetical protein